MKKVLAFLLVLTVVMMVSLSGFAEDNGEISVSSTATVSVTADRAELRIGCVSKDESVTKAQGDNAVVINGILAALDAKGIIKEDITTSEYSVNENYEYKSDVFGNSNRVLKGYEVTHMLRVIIRDIDKVGETIDAATLAGANQSYGISFICSDEKAAYEKALEQAVTDARAKADIIAKAAGIEIVGIESITEGGSSAEYYRNADFTMAAGAASESSTVISAGALTVSATVKIVYSVK
ncbi:MAG: SIMPL domain-containing protein [Eubacteriales bacterium]|nr:SIMPL domain-containing protein [Eubacteriales bacterium]MDD3881517.1 SIMPL domain-containing protein [Eubacteriales bacterium]MDD4513001.1 SIMPL domain-containing protein [Eubacteriales bacterium]